MDGHLSVLEVDLDVTVGLSSSSQICPFSFISHFSWVVCWVGQCELHPISRTSHTVGILMDEHGYSSLRHLHGLESHSMVRGWDARVGRYHSHSILDAFWKPDPRLSRPEF